MSNKTKAVTQTLDILSNMIDSRLGQEPEMDTQGIEISADELMLRSVDERTKKVTDLILRRVEE